MDNQAHFYSPAPRFAAKEAGTILLVTLLAFVLGDYILVKFLIYLQSTPGSYWADRTQNEIGALRSIALGFLNPALVLIVSAALLKFYLPNQSLRELCEQIGMSGKPSVQIVVSSFVVGAGYVFLFMALALIFPRSDLSIPHPENVINFASTAGKIMFAVTACTLVPIAEEVLFRGVLYQGFANSWGKVVAAIFVSIVFIAVHPGTIESGYWLTHAALYLVPFLMIALREFGGTLYAPIAAHAGYNFAEIFF